MLEVKRKANANRGGGTATARARTYAHTVSRPQAETINGRKGPVVAQSSGRFARTTQTLEVKEFQVKTPVITGEVHFRGSIPVDGLVSGQLGGSNACLSVKQKTSARFGSTPELDGELSFKGMLRVNGHITGTVCSCEGTLIVDVGARVDAYIDVAVAVISGTVNGDIVARDRVEVGPAAKIHGNISTRSITIKDGAIFEGVCSMIEEG